MYSETGLLRVLVILLLIFPTFFLSSDQQECVPPVSFEFLKKKKTKWGQIIGVFDIPEIPSKWKDLLSVPSSFPEKTLDETSS